MKNDGTSCQAAVLDSDVTFVVECIPIWMQYGSIQKSFPEDCFRMKFSAKSESFDCQSPLTFGPSVYIIIYFWKASRRKAVSVIVS